MSTRIRIRDGNPTWLSQSIVPSRQTVVSPSSMPTLATIQVDSTDVFVYVKVENIGTEDLGACQCSAAVPIAWTPPATFSRFAYSGEHDSEDLGGGFSFSWSPTADVLIYNSSTIYNFGYPRSGRRTWAISANRKFFAYAGSTNGNDWSLSIIALEAFRRGSMNITRGDLAGRAMGSFGGQWERDNFAWAGSKAVVAAGASGLGYPLTVLCPEAPNGAAWGNTLIHPQIARVSPCASGVAFFPASPNLEAFLVSTASAQQVPFKQNNRSTSVRSGRQDPTITTERHEALGVTIFTGSTTTVDVDDPDCTGVVGGNVLVEVDRVRASTLPSANLGVVPVGSGAAGLLASGDSIWVQVPNTFGWANNSEPHWCLLAQTYTADPGIIPRSWNGRAASPPPFPLADENCAQRNIEISS